MDELKKEDILRYFEEINQHLANMGNHGDILIAGGAALTLVFNARNSTYDIDAIFEPKEDMRKIIKDVAQSNALDDDWLNDAVKGFMTDKMKFSAFLEYSHLTVSSLDAESLSLDSVYLGRLGYLALHNIHYVTGPVLGCVP